MWPFFHVSHISLPWPRCVKRVVELDGKFSNRKKGEDKPDKAGTAYPDNEAGRF